MLMIRKADFKLFMESLLLLKMWIRTAEMDTVNPWINYTCENYIC